MKRRIPLLITFFVGILVILSEFIPHKPFGLLTSGLEDWFMIIAGFAIILGNLNLLKMNAIKIKHKQENWQYYVVAVSSFAIMILAGFLWGTKDQAGLLGQGEAVATFIGSKPFDWLFNNAYEHLAATMFSILAFFIASAAYRSFVGRSPESYLLLIAAILVMLGNTGFGSIFSHISAFIMKYPNTGGQRAIIICAGLGVIGSSLRIITGIERSYLGGE
ncbi:MAG: hypothetical protein K8S56_03955 [Candidatus Cloacimonetes bacterium]|nr:hypothetical protein [Candidatus Cloacimonadota bacterium]